MAAATERRNVLLMVADDLGLMLGCYGLGPIRTPSVDQLAVQGTRFTDIFTSTASCSGSRSTIHTGLHTHQNGQSSIRSGTRPASSARSTSGPARCNRVSGTGRASAATCGRTRFFDKATETGWTFQLTVGLRDAHRDETREGFGNDEDDVRDISVPDYTAADVEIPPFTSSMPELRTEIVEYYMSMSRMDLGVRLIIGELAKRGLDRNTLVIFVSDIGSPFLNSETTLYDAGVRLTLLVRQPGGKSGVGTPFLRVLGDSDVLLSETWTQHAFSPHTFHQIQNYWPTRFRRNHRYKYHQNIAWRLNFPFVSELYGGLSCEGIRNAAPTDQPDTPEMMLGWRRLQNYVYCGPEELFDPEDDPEEVDNLAGKPEFEALLREMQAGPEDWQCETDDPWPFREGVSVMTTHAAQKLGMRLPDRFDFDPKNPGRSTVTAACRATDNNDKVT
ncbi:hypothetical protein DL769_001670 [Monosporascus sp. CRB-8-3]|nr:hypothetical protein DL769_001670 [Monosporascus sp. CRB-8-3]